jgi:small ligand-binding sensory domain FIST
MSAHVAFSSHPHAAQAAGECVGHLVEAGASSADLALIAVTPPFAERLGDVAALVRQVLTPTAVLGVATGGVLVGDDEVVDGPALGILTWSSADRSTRVHLVEGRDAAELAHSLATAPGDALLLFADPFSVPADALLQVLDDSSAPGELAGGHVVGSARPGGNRMVLDAAVRSQGAVGLVLEHVDVASLRCVGGAPVGAPMTVTNSAAADVLELDHRAALVVYEELLVDLQLELDLLAAVQTGVLGLRRLEDGPFDPLERDHLQPIAVRAIDPATGSLRCDPPLDAGDRVVFEVFDEWSTTSDLTRRLGAIGWPDGEQALLVVSDLGRAHRFAFGGVDSVTSLTSDAGLGAAMGVVTSTVLQRRAGAATLEQDVVTVTVVGAGGPGPS